MITIAVLQFKILTIVLFNNEKCRYIYYIWICDSTYKILSRINQVTWDEKLLPPVVRTTIETTIQSILRIDLTSVSPETRNCVLFDLALRYNFGFYDLYRHQFRVNCFVFRKLGESSVNFFFENLHLNHIKSILWVLETEELLLTFSKLKK